MSGIDSCLRTTLLLLLTAAACDLKNDSEAAEDMEETGDSGASDDAGESSGSNGPSSTIPYNERCARLCDATNVEACTDDDASRCQAECEARAEPLPPACQTCVLDSTSSIDAVCSGAGTTGGAEEESCTCAGASFGRIFAGNCLQWCEGLPDMDYGFEARCEVLCSTDGDVCTTDDEAECLDQCARLVQGVTFGCAACLLDASSGLQWECDEGDAGETGGESSCACTGASFAGLSTQACSGFCSGS